MGLINRRQWGAAAAGLMFAAGQRSAKAQAVTVPRPATLPPKLVGTRIVIAVEPRTGLSNLPLTVAEQRNFFREEGLDVELREFADVGQAMAAVQAKAAHAMCVPFAQLLTPSAREMNWQSFVVQGRAPQVVLGVSQKTVPGFRGAGDLRGRRVGLRAKDPLAQRVLMAFLQREQVKEDEVQILPQASAGAALLAFRGGQLDALCHADPMMTLLEQLGELRVAVDTRSLSGTTEVFGGPVPVGCLSAPAEFVEQFPRVTQALTDAVVHALKWLQTAGPSDLIKTVPESHFQGDRAIYLATVERSRDAWTADGLMPRGGPEAVNRVAEGAPLAPAEVARHFTNAFALKAKARFRA